MPPKDKTITPHDTAQAFVSVFDTMFPGLADGLNFFEDPRMQRVGGVFRDLLGEDFTQADKHLMSYGGGDVGAGCDNLAEAVKNGLTRGNLEKAGITFKNDEQYAKFIESAPAVVPRCVDHMGELHGYVLQRELMELVKECELDVVMPGAKFEGEEIAYSKAIEIEAKDLTSVGFVPDAQGQITVYTMNEHGAYDLAGEMTPQAMLHQLGNTAYMQTVNQPDDQNAPINGYSFSSAGGATYFVMLDDIDIGTDGQTKGWVASKDMRNALTSPAEELADAAKGPQNAHEALIKQQMDAAQRVDNNPQVVMGLTPS